MASFIISPYAISFDSIKNNLQTYINNKPEDETWLDFYASSAGETIIEIAAALGAFYAYHFIVGRRETFLSSALNYTSVVGLAENNGYSCNRGTNLQVSINIVPSETITLPKWTVVGSYTEYDVVLTESVILNKGVATNIPVIIGNFIQESQTVSTNKITQFNFVNDSITETYRLILNSTEVPTSTELKDLLNDKWVTLTNVYGGFDTMYLQQGDYSYSSGDTLICQFIERNNLDYTDFSSSNLSIDYANQVNEVTLIEDRIDVEDMDNIKIKAPLYHETSKVIRSRADYKKFLLLSDSTLLDAGDRDVEPGLIELTYLKEDGSFMTEEEKEKWLDAIEEARPSGVARATISEPIKVTKKLKIKLWKSDDEDISSTISTEIDEILDNYENKFNLEIDFHQVEHDIEQLTGVKIARVELTYDDWAADTIYNYYDMVTTDNGNFYVSDYQYFSGDSEPTWPSDIGDTVIDNEIIWERVDDYSLTSVEEWQANTQYTKFDYVVNDEKVYMVSGYTGKSSTSEPDWGEDVVYDNKLVWSLVINGASENSWVASNSYKIGDTISTTSGVYMVTSFTGSSGTSTPDWANPDNGSVVDGNIIWNLMDSNLTEFTLMWNQYLVLTKEYEIVG